MMCPDGWSGSGRARDDPQRGSRPCERSLRCSQKAATLARPCAASVSARAAGRSPARSLGLAPEARTRARLLARRPSPRSSRRRRRRSGGSWSRAAARARRRRSAGRCAPSSTRRRTGSGSRRSSPRPRRRAPTTTSPIPPLVADKTLLRPRPGLAHPRARPPLPRAGRDPLLHVEPLGRGEPAARGMRPASRHGEHGRPPASTSRSGDSWVVNELNSAVRRGDGNARANVRELRPRPVRGRRRRDPTRGAAFVIGFGQSASGRLRLPELAPALARRLRVLDGNGEVRRGLVAGGVRRCARATRSPARRAATARAAQRLPPAQARARERRPGRDRVRARLPAVRRTARSRTPPGSTTQHTAGRRSRRSRWPRTSRRR